MRKRKSERGEQLVEFTLFGIPTIFLLFSIANMCFSMLTLHTIQEAVEQGARYASTRGSTCSSGTNTCTVKVENIADMVAGNAAGVPASALVMTLTSPSGATVSCNPINTCQSGCTTGCSAKQATQWPPTGDNSPGGNITVEVDAPVTAPFAMYWPGTGAEKSQNPTFHATSMQRLLF
jgi:Flp pilus assembly protein TadG